MNIYLLVVFVGLLFAHDTWIMRPKGARRLALCTGAKFPVSDHATDPARVDRWEVATTLSGRRALVDFQPSVNALRRVDPIPASAPLVSVAVLKPHPIELEREKFLAYLTEEGVADEPGLLSRDLVESQKVSEIYTKCAKYVEGYIDGLSDASFGLPLEFDIRRLSASCFELLLCKEGDLVPDARVTVVRARPRGGESTRLTTDRRGRIELDFDSDLYMVRAHLIAPDETGAADFQSIWTSLVLRL